MAYTLMYPKLSVIDLSSPDYWDWDFEINVAFRDENDPIDYYIHNVDYDATSIKVTYDHGRQEVIPPNPLLTCKFFNTSSQAVARFNIHNVSDYVFGVRNKNTPTGTGILDHVLYPGDSISIPWSNASSDYFQLCYILKGTFCAVKRT